jgi:hypothetical protein
MFARASDFLPLFMTRIAANHPDHPMAFNDLAIIADFFYGYSDFHSMPLIGGRPVFPVSIL